MLLNTRGVNLVDTNAVHALSAATTTLGSVPRRIVTTTAGVGYAVIRIDSDNNLRVLKFDTPGDAPTVFSGSGQHTALTSNVKQAMIACDMGADGMLHIVFITESGGAKKVMHVRFDTTDDSWEAEETIQTGTGAALSTQRGNAIDIWVDNDNVPHVVYWNAITNGSAYSLYYSVRTAGTWVTPTAVKTGQADVYFVPRICVDAGGRVLLLSDQGDGDWDGWELVSDTWTATQIDGFGATDMTVTDDGTRHILFSLDKRHTKVKGPLSTLTSTIGAFQFEHPDSDGGAIPYEVPHCNNKGVSVMADGNDLHVLTGARGKIFQGWYRNGVWETLREAGTLSEDLGKRDVIIAKLPRRMRTTGEFWALGKVGFEVSTGTPGLCWLLLNLNKDTPPRGGITHDLVIDGVGYMLGSPLQKADISQAVPRISVATELKKEDNISDLSSVFQTTWHHGRGEREFSDPFAVYEVDGLLTHIPDQVTPQYEDTVSFKTGGSVSDFDGYPAKMILFKGNLYMLLRGNAAANNAMFVWDNTNTEWDTEAAGLDTTTGVPLDMAIHNEDLWVAQGDSVNARTYDFSATAWEDGGVPADAFASWDGKLWRADNINEIYFSSDPDAASPTWTLLGNVDDGSGTTSRIRGFEIYGANLLIFADFGVWQVISNGDGTYRLLPLLDDTPQRHSSNGLARAVFGGVLFYNVGDGVTRFDGATRSDVGPNRSQIGTQRFAPLPTTKRGIVQRLVATDTFMYGAITPDDISTGRATIMIYNGTGWSEFWKSGVNGNRCKFVYYTPALTATGVLSKRNLWVNDGDTLQYIPLPTRTENALNDSAMRFKTGTFGLITGWHTQGLPGLTKVVHELIGRFDNLVAGGAPNGPRVDVYFQLDEGTDSFTTTDWTYLCTFDHSPVETIRITERVQKQGIATPSGAAGGLLYKKIRYLLVVDAAGTTPSTCCIMRGFGERFAVRTQPRYGFTAVVNAYDELVRIDGARETGQAKTLRDTLYALQLQQGPHYVDDGGLIPVINQLYNSSFEIDDSGVPDNWAEVGSDVTTAYSEKHKKRGSFAVKQTVAVGATTANGIEQLITVPKGIKLTFGASVFVEFGTGVVLQIYDDTNSRVLAQSNPVWPISSHRAVARFVDVRLELDAADYEDDDVYSVRIVVPDELCQGVSHGTSVFYVDDAYLYFGEDVPNYYIDGTLARCQWSEPVLAEAGTLAIEVANSQSVQRGSYAVHVTGMNEAFRFRKDPGKLSSQITLFMREASS